MEQEVDLSHLHVHALNSDCRHLSRILIVDGKVHMGQGVFCSVFAPRLLKVQAWLPDGQCAGSQIEQSGFKLWLCSLHCVLRQNT